MLVVLTTIVIISIIGMITLGYLLLTRENKPCTCVEINEHPADIGNEKTWQQVCLESGVDTNTVGTTTDPDARSLTDY